VAAYDRNSGVGGLLHFQLPDSSMDRELAESHPAMFADTGLQLLVSKMTRLGGDPKRALIRIAGGAAIIGGPRIAGPGAAPSEGTGVGKQNYLAIRKLLWRHGLMLEGEAVGGGQGRTLGLTLGTGEFWVTSTEPGAIAV
jgi:chemotaxis protein CheD